MASLSANRTTPISLLSRMSARRNRFLGSIHYRNSQICKSKEFKKQFQGPAIVAVAELSSVDESTSEEFTIGGLHHVGLLCKSTEESLKFYCGILGLEINPERPDSKLPYKGAWLWVGKEMIHLMELPNPDPTSGRPEHGGRDRHACFTVGNVIALGKRLDEAGIPYTMSKSGRAAIFTRDPDGNALEFAE